MARSTCRLAVYQGKADAVTDDRKFVHDMKNVLGIVIGYANLLLDETRADDPKWGDLDQIRKAGESALGLLDTWDASRQREGPA